MVITFLLLYLFNYYVWLWFRRRIYAVPNAYQYNCGLSVVKGRFDSLLERNTISLLSPWLRKATTFACVNDGLHGRKLNHVPAKYKDLRHSANWAGPAVVTYCQLQLIHFAAQVFQMVFMYINFVCHISARCAVVSSSSASETAETSQATLF